jgi:hypothetical protein
MTILVNLDDHTQHGRASASYLAKTASEQRPNVTNQNVNSVKNYGLGHAIRTAPADRLNSELEMMMNG